jgi:endonuclease V-like protein UPF0215 family
MTRSFAVKKEIRTLGLDLCNPRRLVGAVTRGGYYLDGILVLTLNPRLKTTLIASEILRSRFFPELRLIMTYDPETRLDPKVIERLTRLPVIRVDSTRNRQSDGFKSFKIGRKQLQAKSSLPPRILRQILFTTWTTGILPEPLRVAHLLARSRFFHGKTRVSKPTNKFAL